MDFDFKIVKDISDHEWPYSLFLEANFFAEELHVRKSGGQF